MEIINGVEVGAEADVDLDSVDINGGTIDGTVIGGTTPAAGSFTTLKASTDPTDANGVGDRGFTDGRYCLEANNLSDISNVATAFGNIKQVATDSATGVSELATDAETVTGTATDRVTTPANITAKMAAPGAIGGTIPAVGNFTTIDASGQVQGILLNNQMVSKAIFDVLDLMTDPRCLYMQMEDPSVGTLYDASGQGHNGTYQGSMASGDRIKKGMGWSLDFDGTDDYVNLGDHNDFSFGDGSNDEMVTWFGMVEVTDSVLDRELISRWNNISESEAREYLIRFNSDEKIYCFFYDESANVNCSRISDSGVGVGFHSFVITYDGTGGATAADGIKIYIDGSIIASTATNSGSYVAMENIVTDLCFGVLKDTSGNPSGFYDGDVACIGIDGSEWSAKSVWRFHQLCKGIYGI